MIRKTLAAVATAAACVLGTAGTAAAAPVQPPAPQWIAIFYFGTQTYCTQAGMAAQQMGALTAGGWMCDSGWLMVKRPGTR